MLIFLADVTRENRASVAPVSVNCATLSEVLPAKSVVTLSHIVALGIEPSLEVTRAYRVPHVSHMMDEKGRMNPYPTYGNAAYVVLAFESGVDRPFGDAEERPRW